MTPARDREMHVEHIKGFFDWRKFLAPLDLSLSGLAILEHEPDVNFSFRMVTRGDIKTYDGFDKWMAMTEEEQQDH